ncbi:hypothetical protein HK097_002395 [Rhizophlyctis rosea]|uniref:Yeast cell wall synthesis Kre9/Knh1-like N-terminal domain-containing protein n=1 Tax=Rhizophlyctis rosea TaxID=64517 RepID=A0AAD5X193_9FUNG|nr:hypothetical protein HK097_002395 [Rhizophlyctis rosea]
MHFNSILLAALASFSAVNAATIVWKTPVPGGSTNWKPGQAVTIEWTFVQNGTTNELPNVGPNDVAVFNLQDLRGGLNTGQNIGAIIGQVPISVGQVTGSIPTGLADGTNYTIRAAFNGKPELAYTPQFQISGGTPAASATVRPTTTTSAAASSTSASRTSSTTAAATTTQAGNSGATSNSANVLGALAIGVVAALAA